MSDIYEKIAKQYDNMSKTQKKIADYILLNRVSVSFLSVNKLASAADVSEASVIRFANFLGFDGYSQLQHLMQTNIQNNMGTRERLTLSYSAYDDWEEGIAQLFNEEVERISNTLKNLNMDMFFGIVDEMVKAERIFIVCGRSVTGLGLFFQYYLQLVSTQVYLIHDLEGNEERISNLGMGDLVIALSFKRYTKRTVQLVQFMAKKACKIVSITDYMTSPLIKYSHYYLLSQTQMSTYLDSFVAPQAIINALLTYVGKTKNKQLEQKFQDVEEIWDEMDIFLN